LILHFFCVTPNRRPPVKDAVVTVRLEADEVAALDAYTRGALMTRSQVLRLLVRHFAALPEEQQRSLLSEQLFRH
jgi:hypothetical protein